MMQWYSVFPVHWTLEQTDAWVARRVKIDPPVIPRPADHEASRAAREFSSKAPAEWARRTEAFEIGPADAIRHRRAFDRDATADMWQRHWVQHVRLVPL